MSNTMYPISIFCKEEDTTPYMVKKMIKEGLVDSERTSSGRYHVDLIGYRERKKREKASKPHTQK